MVRTADPTFQVDESFALSMDRDDPIAAYRDRFLIPKSIAGGRAIYFAGNSLGLQPVGVRERLDRELHDWADLGVEGHFEGQTPWYSYHEIFRDIGARLVGGRPGEVVMMNSLTVNLHLMLVSFYRPTKQRYKILMEYPVFPSDTYAIKTQLQYHGFDPNDALIVVKPRTGESSTRIDEGKTRRAGVPHPRAEYCLSLEDIEETLDREGERIALVMFAGVNFFTGQALDMARITAAAQANGCVAGWDLAHAAGNLVLNLHDWNVDFAVWCNYKYLNSGPGAVGGCFVHENHHARNDLPRFGGWWGNDPNTRFGMHLLPDFIPRQSADGWQVSNPPIFALAPVKVSYDIFDEVGMVALRRKSELLTGYLQFLIDQAGADRIEVITPRDPAARGCQLSMLVHDRPKELLPRLRQSGVICDFREPNVVRVAPVPLYNSYHDVWRFAQVLSNK